MSKRARRVDADTRDPDDDDDDERDLDEEGTVEESAEEARSLSTAPPPPAKTPRRFTAKALSQPPPVPQPEPGPTLPPSFYGARALFLLLRLGAPHPIQLSFVAAPGQRDADILELLSVRPTWRVERRAPRIFDVELPSDELEPFVNEHHARFRRVDAKGWLFGEAVPGGDDRAEITIEMDEPPTIERKRELAGLGVHVVGESPGELRGVILGKNLADLIAASWIGPVEVRKVHPQKT